MEFAKFNLFHGGKMFIKVNPANYDMMKNHKVTEDLFESNFLVVFSISFF